MKKKAVKEYAEFTVTVVDGTLRALRLRFEGELEKWVPKSVVVGEQGASLSAGSVVRVRIQSWFCKKEGLI